jgi:hypothetical protein
VVLGFVILIAVSLSKESHHSVMGQALNPRPTVQTRYAYTYATPT